jgi:hypothetical protein
MCVALSVLYFVPFAIPAKAGIHFNRHIIMINLIALMVDFMKRGAGYLLGFMLQPNLRGLQVLNTV